jgi:anti-sigma factor (TIGR02949 family)
MSELKKDPCSQLGPSDAVDCRTALQQLWDYLDGELEAPRMDAIRAHLARCSHCYPHYDVEKAFLEAVHSCQCTTCAPTDVRCRVMDALRRIGFAPQQKTTA